MRKAVSVFSLCLAALVGLAVLGGCSGAGNPSAPPDPVMEELSGWPDNPYTQAVLQPRAGTPDYAVYDGEAGYYSVFLRDITLSEGKQYLKELRDSGFEPVDGAEEAVAVGELLQKDGVFLSVSASEGVLGLYITLEGEG